MADLQREQFVQVFFQPAFESANPRMIDWMLVNGEKIPVVKFIVIRPLFGGNLVNVAEWPNIDEVIADPEFVGTDPASYAVYPVWKQFNQSLDMVRSTIWLYNADTHLFISGTPGFRTTVYQNDTITWTPALVWDDFLEEWIPGTLDGGHYMAIATGYDAFTGGTQSLVFTWQFTVENPHILTTLTLEPVSATKTIPYPVIVQTQSYTVTAKDQYGNGINNVDVALVTTFGALSEPNVTTGALGTATFTLSAGTGGVAHITATAGVLPPATATCTFIATPPPHFATTVILTPETQSVIFWSPYTGTATFNVLVKNELGDPMPGVVVSLSKTFGTLSASSVTTGALGTATFTLSSTLGGSAVVTATAAPAVSDTAAVTFVKVPAPPD
jgi:hypothetical protein